MVSQSSVTKSSSRLMGAHELQQCIMNSPFGLQISPSPCLGKWGGEGQTECVVCAYDRQGAVDVGSVCLVAEIK